MQPRLYRGNLDDNTCASNASEIATAGIGPRPSPAFLCAALARTPSRVAAGPQLDGWTLHSGRGAASHPSVPVLPTTRSRRPCLRSCRSLALLVDLAGRTGRHVGPYISMLLSSLEAAGLLPSESEAQVSSRQLRCIFRNNLMRFGWLDGSCVHLVRRALAGLEAGCAAAFVLAHADVCVGCGCGSVPRVSCAALRCCCRGSLLYAPACATRPPSACAVPAFGRLRCAMPCCPC